MHQLFSNFSSLSFQYEQKRQIASGAFSSVFCIRARTKRSQILYAAKYLKTPLEVAQQEIDILIKLRNCSQVVKFIEVFHCNFYTIVVTEFLSGGDLFEKLSAPSYHLTEEKCQMFIRQILQGQSFYSSLISFMIKNKQQPESDHY